MKFSKKGLIVTTVSTAVAIALGGNQAMASIGVGNFTNLLQETVLSFLPTELSGLVGKDGSIQLEKSLEEISNKGIAVAESKIKQDGWGTATSGQVSSNLTKDQLEVAMGTNQKLHDKALKDFEETAPKIEQTLSENESESTSSLEGIDKNNKLQSVLNANLQRQIKSTDNLVTAQQIANADTIRRNQEERTKNIKDRIALGVMRQDAVRTSAMANERFFPDANGQMQSPTGGK